MAGTVCCNKMGDKFCVINKEECMGQIHINEKICESWWLTGRERKGKGEFKDSGTVAGEEGKDLWEEEDEFERMSEVAFEKPAEHIHINLLNISVC